MSEPVIGVLPSPLVPPEQLAILRGDDHVSAMHNAAADIASGMVFGYLRGAVPDPLPRDVAAVALAAALRLLVDVGQRSSMQLAASEESEPDELIGWRGGFQGFTLAELTVLNRWRRRTA